MGCVGVEEGEIYGLTVASAGRGTAMAWVTVASAERQRTGPCSRASDPISAREEMGRQTNATTNIHRTNDNTKHIKPPNTIHRIKSFFRILRNGV